MTPTEGCSTCELAKVLAQTGRPTDPYVAEEVDVDAAVISGKELEGLVVIPRQHVGGLEELSIDRRAHVLASLRRATLWVQEKNPGSATEVVVKFDPPASAGHVCFHVLTRRSDDQGGRTETPA